MLRLARDEYRCGRLPRIGRSHPKVPAMPVQPGDFRSPDTAAAAAADAAERNTAALHSGVRAAADPDDSGLFAAADREHLEREIAAIVGCLAPRRPGTRILD